MNIWRMLLGLLLLCLTLAVRAESVPIVVEQQTYASDFEQPTSVALDDHQRLWIVDGGKHRVVVMDKSGKVLFSFGEGPNGLHLPMFISIAGERVAVADSGHQRLMLYDLQGRLQRVIEPKFTHQAERKYEPARPVAVLLQEQKLYWSDQANHQICSLALDGPPDVLAECLGQRGEGVDDFQYPFQIAADSGGYLHIVDVLNARIKITHSKGRVFSELSGFGIKPGRLFRPNGLAIDDQDRVYVADNYFGTISVFQQGRFLGKLRDQQGQELKFVAPAGLFWREQQLYVADALAGKIYRLQLATQALALDQTKANESEPALSQKNCVICHLEWSDVKVTPSNEVKAVASSKMCYSCHNGVIMDSRLQIPHGGQHPSVDDAGADKISLKHMLERKDKLPTLFPLAADKQLLCSSCHTPHNSADKHETLYDHNQNGWLRVTAHNGDLCERCHESKQKGTRERDPKLRGQNHPLGLTFAEPTEPKAPGYVKEQKLRTGLPVSLKEHFGSLDSQKQLICQTCHQIHGGVGNELLTQSQEHSALCVQCHASKNSSDKKDAQRKGLHPVNVKLEKPIQRDREKITHVQCQSCHQVHDAKMGTPLLPDRIKDRNELCAECHQQQHAKDREEARHKGVHPVNFRLEKPLKFGQKQITEITCSTCHSVHEGSPGTAALVNRVKTAEALCVDCHKRQHADDKDDARKKGVHPVTINKTKIRQVGCLSCHSVHHGVKETPTLVESHQNGELCEHCHQHKQAVVGSDHDLRITAKNHLNHYAQLPAESGVCGTCHSMHQHDGAETQPKFHLNAVNALQIIDAKRDPIIFKEDALCLNCHQQEGVAKDKPIRHFKHPYKDMILRSDKKVLPLLDQHEQVKEFGAIACITCHDPHVWKALEKAEIPTWTQNRTNQEGTMVNSFLRRKDPKGTFCVDCHGIETLPKYKYFHDPKLVRGLGVDYLQ